MWPFKRAPAVEVVASPGTSDPRGWPTEFVKNQNALDKHEFADFIHSQKPGEFAIRPVYIKATDSLVVYFESCPSYEDNVSPNVSVYRTDNKRIVGVEINGVSRLMK